MKFRNYKKFHKHITFLMVLKEKAELLEWEIAEENFPGKEENE